MPSVVLSPGWQRVRQARQFVEASLRDAGFVTFPAALLVSEIVTKISDHATTPCTVLVEITGPRVRVEVVDGQVLNLVDVPIIGALARRCGSDDDATGQRRVWFEVDPQRSP